MAARRRQGIDRQRARRRRAGRNRAGHHGRGRFRTQSSSPTMARAFPRPPSGSSPISTPRPRRTPPMWRRPVDSRATRCRAILPMGYVLDGRSGSVVIEANGRAHHIDFTVDPIRRTPMVEIRSEPSAVKIGTRVTVRWPNSPRSALDDVEDDFLRLAVYYVWLNPHLSLTATWFGEEVVAWTASDPAWSKWKPDFATSPHWYSPERLRLLIASEIAHAEDSRKPSPSVREFVQQFRGLSSTVKASTHLRAPERRRARDAGGLLSTRARRHRAPVGDAGPVGAGQAGPARRDRQRPSGIDAGRQRL